MNQKVSLCMIAKDEEQCIGKAIRSVKHLCCEYIVVDTGSCDRTCEEAIRNGAIVYSYEWNDDFAAARNFGLEKAHGDWILILDADEVLSTTSTDDFYSLLNDSIEGYYFPIYSYIGSGRYISSDFALRLFRNKKEYRFEGPIHEQVVHSIKRTNSTDKIKYADFAIFHYGYLDEVIAVKQKKIRNSRIINKALRQEPHNAFLMYSLSMEYLQSGDINKGEEYLRKALCNLSGNEGYFRHVVIMLAMCLWTQRKYRELNLHIEKALAVIPNEPALKYFTGLVEIVNGRYEQALINLMSAHGAEEVVSKHYLLLLIAEVNSALGNYIAAIQYYKAALEINPRVLYPVLQLVGIRQKDAGLITWETISGALDNTLNEVSWEKVLVFNDPDIKLLFALLIMLKPNHAIEELVDLCLEENDKNAHLQCIDARKIIKYELKYVKTAVNMPKCKICNINILTNIYRILEVLTGYICPVFKPNPVQLLERNV